MNRLYGIRADVAREIFEDIEYRLVVKYGKTGLFNVDDFDKLKKKYTEGEE